jgi:hypothetical protein
LALAALLTGAGAPVGGLEGRALADDASKPTVSISPNPVDYKRGVKVRISGSGFRPNQELGLVVTMGGAPSDISGLVEPKPVANEKGEFNSVWELDDEIRRKLLEPRSHTIEVVDPEWQTLAKTTLAFKKVEEKEHKK